MNLKISNTIVVIAIIIFFIITIAIIISGNELFLQYKNSKTNNKKYGYQEQYSNSTEAVELLAKLHQNMSRFVSELEQKYPNDKKVKRLVHGFNRVEIEEAPDEKDSTSYTINKGDLMALCLREKKPSNPLHDYNTMLFVIIHEMSHIMSVSEGHNAEFIENFKFLLKEASNMKYYIPVNYKQNPIEYCGLKVTNNPYY
jgi:hypothetical protein